MKTIIEFDLKEPYEKMAAQRCLKADSAYNALYKIREMLYKKIDETDTECIRDIIADVNIIIDYENIHLEEEWA